jgi:hypothetical protein
MRQFLVCSLVIVGLACSNAGKTTNEGTGGSGGTTVAATGTGGTSGTTTNTSGGPANGGSGGNTTTSGSGGATVSGTGGATSAGGATRAGGDSGTGGATRAGTGGATGTGAGGRAGAGTGGTTGTGAGGRTGAGTGGATGTGNGGSTGHGGSTGNPGGIVTGPAPVDPTTVAAGLPSYYISPAGNDSKSGTSPEEAWKTIANIPTDKPSAVYFERGGTFTAAGGPAIGRNGPAAFNTVKGSVWMAYGTGDKRPILEATEKTAGKATGAVLSPGGDSVLAGLSFTGKANFGLLIETDNNIIQDCEIDGEIEGTLIQLGFSVRGHNNLVVGNYIHDLHEVILDSGSVNTSGGAEAIVINGTDHEIAYNTIDNCWTPNETLGGAEGGCLEVIARTPGEVVENVTFHHNYCTHSVGLFEACAGNFAGTSERIQEHHAVLRNTTLAYNVVIDAMWLYLLQTVNTDMDKLIFEHNTLIHGPANTDIPQGGAPGFGNFYDTDRWIATGGMTPAPKSCSASADCGVPNSVCLGGNCVYQTKAQPGQIIVRNNLFVVLPGATAATMKLPPGADDVMGNIFSPKAPSGVTASAGHVTIVTDPGLVTDSYKLGANSPAIDQASKDSVKPWPDFDGSTVPCGNGPDVGAFEYCP